MGGRHHAHTVGDAQFRALRGHRSGVTPTTSSVASAREVSPEVLAMVRAAAKARSSGATPLTCLSPATVPITGPLAGRFSAACSSPGAVRHSMRAAGMPLRMTSTRPAPTPMPRNTLAQASELATKASMPGDQ